MDEVKNAAVQPVDLADRALTAETVSSNDHGFPTGVKADELPEETLSDFSNAPVEFEETALIVMEDAQRLYYHAGIANRFSENYLKYCAQLESYIKKAGSMCLLKAVLEQKGQSFPKLTDLNVLELIRMVSFHIRKCHAAINGLYKDNNKLGLVYFSQEIRWINLCDRLKVTAAKIEKVQSGELDADSLVKQEEVTKNQPRTNEGEKTGLPQNFQANPKALPLDRTIAAEMLRLQQAAEKEQREAKRKQRSDDREQKRLEHEMGYEAFEPDWDVIKSTLSQQQLTREDAPDDGFEFEDFLLERESEEDKMPEGYITEAEGRRILMDEAMRRGDQESLAAIPLEDSNTFYKRWMRFYDTFT